MNVYHDNDTPLINLNINNQNFVTLIDSGAAVSLINIKFVQKSKITPLNSEVILRSASDNIINVCGTTEICIKIKNKRLYHRAYVTNCDSFPADFLMGANILKKGNSTICWSNQSVRFYNHVFSFIRKNDINQYVPDINVKHLNTCHSVNIPSNSSFNTTIKTNLPDDTYLINNCTIGNAIIIPSFIAEVKNKVMPINFINITNNSFHIAKNKMLTTVENFQQNSVTDDMSPKINAISYVDKNRNIIPADIQGTKDNNMKQRISNPMQQTS